LRKGEKTRLEKYFGGNGPATKGKVGQRGNGRVKLKHQSQQEKTHKKREKGGWEGGDEFDPKKNDFGKQPACRRAKSRGSKWNKKDLHKRQKPERSGQKETWPTQRGGTGRGPRGARKNAKATTKERGKEKRHALVVRR